jgi:hypothetical protein
VVGILRPRVLIGNIEDANGVPGVTNGLSEVMRSL